MADRVLPAAEIAVGGVSAAPAKAPAYAYYALLLLVLANFFNYVDRHIISVVAHSLQQDLKFTDAQLGFLLGTAFAILYGMLGIAMGRIADALSRTKLMAVGLTLWSAMTALSGFAGSFAALATARIGVGIGEAVANPCSHSLLSDYFPARNRAAVLGTYLTGIHLGTAGSLIMGGMLLQHWGELCTVLPGNACRIANWQAAFFAVGLPGLVLAVLISGLREPFRPPPPPDVKPLALVLRELSTALPPFTFFSVFQIGGWPAVRRNLVMCAGSVAGAVGLGLATGDWPQWIAVGIGTYSVLTWQQVLSHRDRPLSKLTFGCPTFVLVMIASALIGCVSGGVLAWSAPYVMRTLHAPMGAVGLYLGLAAAVSGCLSAVVGGLITDRWKRRDARAPVWMGLIAVFAPIPFLVLMMRAQDLQSFVAAYFGFGLLSLCWSGGFGAIVMDLVLPRMRATASATFSLITVLLSSGLGPYWAGKISTLTGSLTTGLYSLLVLVPVTAILLLLAAGRLRAETGEARRARAAAAGEIL